MLSGMVRPDTGEGGLAKRTTDTTLKVTGAIVSVVWIGLAGWYVVATWPAVRDLEPNALGDFLAGTFAPLAFLWLVLGFYQQGEELRNSVDALTLQSEEMRHSVEQQRLLAEATREQVEREGRAFEEAEALRRSATVRAAFVKRGDSSYRLHVTNDGPAVARNVQLIVPDDNGLLLDQEVNAVFPAVLHPTQSVQLIVRNHLKSPRFLNLILEWDDGNGAQQREMRLSVY